MIHAHSFSLLTLDWGGRTISPRKYDGGLVGAKYYYHKEIRFGGYSVFFFCCVAPLSPSLKQEAKINK